MATNILPMGYRPRPKWVKPALTVASFAVFVVCALAVSSQVVPHIANIVEAEMSRDGSYYHRSY